MILFATIGSRYLAMEVNSSKITDLLAGSSTATLASVQHLRLTSLPGDDLAEDDFAYRVNSLLEAMSGLVSITICIPSMARLHPSNSLPKVLDILHSASHRHPQCRLGLVVLEAEQAWSALTVLNRIIELQLELHSLELSRAFFPIGAFLRTAQACNLACLTLHTTQVSVAPEEATGTDTSVPVRIPSLSSLTADMHSEPSSGMQVLLQTAASTLSHLDLSRDGGSVTIRGLNFPRLARLNLSEVLLPEIVHAQMPVLQNLSILTITHTESCRLIQDRLQSLPQAPEVRVSRVVAGEVSDALARLAETFVAVNIVIETLAVRDPAQVKPAALAISEHLTNAGPPIEHDWPLALGDLQYTQLKSIALKLYESSNYEEFIALLKAPNLLSPPKISIVKKKNQNKKR